MQTDMESRMSSIIDLNAELAKLTLFRRTPSFALHAGMIAVISQRAWHRFHSSEGMRLMRAAPFPGEHIELDVDDPRTVEHKKT
jgi:hypothetical protein